MEEQKREGKEEAMKKVSKNEEERIDFVTTYSAQLNNIAKILHANQHLLQKGMLREVSPNHPK